MLSSSHWALSSLVSKAQSWSFLIINGRSWSHLGHKGCSLMSTWSIILLYVQMISGDWHRILALVISVVLLLFVSSPLVKFPLLFTEASFLSGAIHNGRNIVDWARDVEIWTILGLSVASSVLLHLGILLDIIAFSRCSLVGSDSNVRFGLHRETIRALCILVVPDSLTCSRRSSSACANINLSRVREEWIISRRIPVSCPWEFISYILVSDRLWSLLIPNLTWARTLISNHERVEDFSFGTSVDIAANDIRLKYVHADLFELILTLVLGEHLLFLLITILGVSLWFLIALNGLPWHHILRLRVISVMVVIVVEVFLSVI